MDEEIRKELEAEKRKSAEAVLGERERLKKVIEEKEKLAAERRAKEEEEQRKLKEQLAASEAAAQQIQAQEAMDTSHATSYVDSPLAELRPKLDAILQKSGRPTGGRNMSTPLLSPILPVGSANLFGINRILNPSVPVIDEENEPMDTQDVNRENREENQNENPPENQGEQNVGQTEGETSQGGATDGDAQYDPADPNQTLDGSMIDTQQLVRDIARSTVEQTVAQVLGSGSSAPKSYAFVAKSPLQVTRTEAARIVSSPQPGTSRAQGSGLPYPLGPVPPPKVPPKVRAPQQLPIQSVRPLTPDILATNEDDVTLEEGTGAEIEARFGPMLDE